MTERLGGMGGATAPLTNAHLKHLVLNLKFVLKPHEHAQQGCVVDSNDFEDSLVFELAPPLAVEPRGVLGRLARDWERP